MNCRECGASIPDDSVFCPECGKPAGTPAGTPAPVATPPPPPPPWPGPTAAPTGSHAAVPNYLVQSILVTVFCCLPLGIAGIINSSQASSKQAAGDYDGAVKSAQRAKLFCWIAVGAGLVGAAIYAVVAAANGGTDF